MVDRAGLSLAPGPSVSTCAQGWSALGSGLSTLRPGGSLTIHCDTLHMVTRCFMFLPSSTDISKLAL
jgi:hypothetical protein